MAKYVIEKPVEVVFFKKTSDGTAPIFDSTQIYSFEQVQYVVDCYFGVPHNCTCNRAKRPRNKAFCGMDKFMTFPADSKYGLTDCGEVVEGGEYTITQSAIALGKPEKKPVKAAKKSEKTTTPEA